MMVKWAGKKERAWDKERVGKKERAWNKETAWDRVKAWDRDSRKACLVLVGGFFVLVLSAFWGELRRRDALTTVFLEGEYNTEAFLAEECDTEAFLAEEHDAEAFFAGEYDAEAFLAQEQWEDLQQLEIFMAGASIHQAAVWLRREEKQLQKLREAAEEITGQEVLYIGDGKVVSLLEGMGFALLRDGVFFYGNFQKGRPEGVCTAIAWTEGEGADYVYSMGLWRDGQMEGLGITGRYVQREGEKTPGFQEQISGIFQKDRLEGRLTYEQVNARGRSCWWEITAREGKTCLDERWSFRPGLGEYRLLSEKEKRACFVIPQNLLEQVWWKNRVPWK